MAQASIKHEYEPHLHTERYEEVWSEPKQHISGWFLGFNTEYRKILLDYKEREVFYCKRCGENGEHENHDLIIKADRMGV